MRIKSRFILAALGYHYLTTPDEEMNGVKLLWWQLLHVAAWRFKEVVLGGRSRRLARGGRC